MDAVERAPDPVAEALHRLARAVPTLRVLVTGRHPVGCPANGSGRCRRWTCPRPTLDPAEPDVLAG